MTAQTINIQLPDELYRRLRNTAIVTEQPLEVIILRSIQGNLPPALDDLHPDTHSIVADLDTMNDDAIWAVAQQSLSTRLWRRHQALLQKLQEFPLSEKEQAELTNLRNKVDHAILRRSYALALLKWRGYTLPAAQTP